MWKRGKLSFVLFSVQTIMLIAFILNAYYTEDADGSNAYHSYAPRLGGKDPRKNSIEKLLLYFRDGQLLILLAVGLGFASIKSYTFSSFSFNLLIYCLCSQWILIIHCFLNKNSIIIIGISEIVRTQKISFSLFISVGVIIGKCSSIQTVIMCLIEAPLLVFNEHFGINILHVSDIGGGIHCYVFSTYFGLGVSLMLSKFTNSPKRKLNTDYISELIILMSLAIFAAVWPGFCASFASGDKKHRIVIHTYLSICSSCVVAFAISSLRDTKNRFSIIGIIAGAVSVSSIADLMIAPYFAVLIGFTASLVALLFYNFVNPLLSKQFSLHDTLAIQSSFGIPAILSAVCSALFAYTASERDYNYSLYQIFRARAPVENSSDIQEVQSYLNGVNAGTGRSNDQQALCQLLYLGTTLIIAAISGILTGIIIRQPYFETLKHDELFEDGVNCVLAVEIEEFFGNESCCDIESSIEAGMNMHNLRLPQQPFHKKKSNIQQV